MTKKVAVNVREAKLMEQAFSKNSFRYLTLDEHKVLDKAYKALKESEVYNKVGWEIQAEAERLVAEKCMPEWNRISEEMKPLGELRNKLAKEKAEIPEDWVWEAEKEAQLNGLDKEMSDLSAEYQKVTDEANAELNEFKEEKINNTKEACFFLSEEDYQFVGELCWFYSAN